MKIIKEDLDNLERVKNRQTVQGIMMKDAEEQSKKSEDNFKEVAGNPEDLKKKKPFISGEKQPKPKDVKTPKPELEESLFEDYSNNTTQLVISLRDSIDKTIYYSRELMDQLRANGDESNANFIYDAVFWPLFDDEEIMKVLDELLVEYRDKKESTVTSTKTKPINEAEDTNRVFQYSVDIIESPNHSSRDMSDKILGVLQDAGIRAIGCMSSDTSWSMTEYGLSESKDVRKSTKLQEAGGMKDGVLMSTDGEPLTFWDKIYAELDATAGDDYDYLKLREVPAKNKDRYVEIGVTQSGDIKVFAPEKQMLKHAVTVANYYGLDYIVDTSVGFNDPQKAFYCLVRIPAELGDTEITYDVRKPETMKKDNNTQVA